MNANMTLGREVDVFGDIFKAMRIIQHNVLFSTVAPIIAFRY